MGMSNAEKQRAYIARLKARAAESVDMSAALAKRDKRIAAQEKRIAALEEELERASVADLSAALGKMGPSDDSDEVAALQRQLKAARTQIANLRTKVHVLSTGLDQQRRRNPHMTKEMHRAILRCLHPDVAPDALKRRFHEAFVGFNAIKFPGVND